MPPKIVTFTGASGTGKSTLVKELLKDSHAFRLVTSTTTRPPRSSDLPGEYEYWTPQQMEKDASLFIWKTEYAGNFYGTRYRVLNDACELPQTSLMILVPKVLPDLLAYLHQQVLPFYVRAPDEDILRLRLLRRGDDPESIERRLQTILDWEREATSGRIPYRMITNNGTIDEGVQQVKEYLGQNL